jgi:hypothetical protein
MNPFKVVCINDAARPDGIPTSKWVKVGQTYTVIQATKLTLQGGLIGFKLAEINLDDCLPYQFFASTRFGIPVDPAVRKEVVVEELVEECEMA